MMMGNTCTQSLYYTNFVNLHITLVKERTVNTRKLLDTYLL